MENSQPLSSSTYAVSRSRGKHPNESSLQARYREMRKARGGGGVRSSDESEPEDDLESGAMILHKMFNRRVILHADKTVVKSGRRIPIGEADALRVAARAGIPVPRVHEACQSCDGETHIRMDHVQGESLDKLWPDMSAEQKKDIARQLRAIVEKMRSATPPQGLIGACDATEIRDTRQYSTYHSPPCGDEKAFNEFIMSGLLNGTAPLLREALFRRLKTSHRVVLTHCDLAPRNILIQDGKIKALIDWEDGGWYPEYWEYVKFFQRNNDKDFRQYAIDIFPELYHDELVDYTAISKWQKP